MTPEQAAVEWKRCRPLIEAAIATGPGVESIEDVEIRVENAQYQFWAAPNSAAITEILAYDQKKALNVVHGGGDLTELLDVLEPAMCDYARENGCDMMMGMGRKGWERVTERRGYRFGWLTMVKNLSQ